MTIKIHKRSDITYRGILGRFFDIPEINWHDGRDFASENELIIWTPKIDPIYPKSWNFTVTHKELDARYVYKLKKNSNAY